VEVMPYKQHGMVVGILMGVTASVFLATVAMALTDTKIVLSARITTGLP
jgi:hypothetical protein